MVGLIFYLYRYWILDGGLRGEVLRFDRCALQDRAGVVSSHENEGETQKQSNSKQNSSIGWCEID